MKKSLLLFLMMAAALTSQAQGALDFAQKFMTLCEGDTTVKCITVSPKMMEQIAENHQITEEHTEALQQAIGKLKSMRIVSAPAELYERAEQLMAKHRRRFKAEENFDTDNARGTFYTRKNRHGQTAELILLREDKTRNLLTIVCLTGDLDKEFLCFLYNNKSLKN